MADEGLRQSGVTTRRRVLVKGARLAYVVPAILAVTRVDPAFAGASGNQNGQGGNQNGQGGH
jgi:hypothetical protein